MDSAHTKSPVWMFALGCGIVLGLGLLAAGAAFAVYVYASHGDSPTESDVPEQPAQNENADAGVGVPTSQGLDPELEMRSRYRLGHNIRVVAMSPNPNRVRAHAQNAPHLQGGPSENPFRVFGAEYRAAPLSVGDGERLERADGRSQEPISLLVGVPERIALHGTRPALAYAISFEGYPGHFFVPSTAPTEFGPVAGAAATEGTLALAMSVAQTPDRSLIARGASFSVVAHIVALYSDQMLSEPLDVTLNIESVGVGDVEIALVMEETTDLDLYVEDPTGSTLSYRNRRNSAGGELDLDANAGCGSNMGVNAEHIFYPEHAAPVGRYSVLVSHYQDCTRGRAIPYRITVRACGETAILSGEFAAHTARTEGCPSTRDDPACQTVVAFTLPNCE